mgnify:CR=1 FL=1
MGIFDQQSDMKNFPKQNPVSTFLIASVTLMFFVLIFDGGFTNVNMYNYGALFEPAVFQGGEWWRIFTVMFLHGSISHYIFNTIFGLFIIGSALERLIGSFRYALVYFISGIGSSFTILLLYYFGGDAVLTVGASGAIYGVLGTFLYLTINHPEMFDPRDAQGIKGLIVINVIFTFRAANISIAGHIGGLITGYLIAAFLFKDKAKRKKQWQNKSYYQDPFTDVRDLEDIDTVDDDDDDDPFRKYDQ